MDAFLAEAVPDPLDRLDLDALNRPLDGVQRGLLGGAAAARAGADRRGPAPARRRAAHAAPRRVRRHAVGVRRGRTAGRGAVGAARGRSTWAGGRASSTPWPAGRPGSGCASCWRWPARATCASSGPACEVEIADGAFRATSAAIPEAVTTDVLVDARLPDPSASRSCDPWWRRSCATAWRARRCCATSTAACCATPARCGCGPPTARSSTRPGGRIRAGSRSARTPPCGWRARSPGPA